MNIPNDETLSKLKKNQILVGLLNPYTNDKKLKDIILNDVKCFSLELLPESREHNQWIFYHLKQI